MTHPILEVARVTMRFGGIVALNDVSLQVRQGDIHAVIGPNGAGKSTLLNVITGIYRPTSGAVRLQGGQLDRLPPHRICRLGVCRTFQNTELFGEMSALENVQVGFHLAPPYGMAGALLHGPRYA
ncbi:ATP-binding cassette domain-containing protein, partial [Bordetella pertussis]